MTIDLIGKAVKQFKLPTVNYNNEPVKVIPAQVGDTNSRCFIISLFDDRGIINLSPYNQAMLNARLPDETLQIKEQTIDYENNTIICELTTSMLSLQGNVICDITLTGEDATGNYLQLTSRCFYVLVAKSQADDEALEASDDYSLLVKLMKEISDLENNIETAEADRTTAEETRQNNENTRELQENIRNTNEQERIANENERKTNENARQNVYTTLQANIDAEATARANADTNLQSQINTLDTTKANKTDVTAEINSAVSAVVDSAPEAFDTLKEISDWIAEDESGTSALIARVSAIETKNTEQDTAIDNKPGLIVIDESTGEVGEIFNDLDNNVASGKYSHAEGAGTEASGGYSHAECLKTTASGYSSHAEGNNTTASGEVSHAEGYNTTAKGSYSHAEGYATLASNGYSHTEGKGTIAMGLYSHAEGSSTVASGDYSHAEGQSTTASGDYSHAEGSGTTARGNYSHAEGVTTQANSDGSHAEGSYTTASGYYSHAEGSSTVASGINSHAAGVYTTADQQNQTAVGQYNLKSQTGALFSVGNGTSSSARSTAFEVFQDGHVEILGGTITYDADSDTFTI